jgi:ribosome-associated protein
MKIIIPDNELEILISRSGGAGGQNVNKVNTKVTIRFNVLTSSVLSEEVKARFVKNYSSKISDDGVITIISQEHRTQKLNLDEALSKLHRMIEEVRLPPKIRRKTKPTKASKIKRVEGKKKRGDIKKMRSEKF